MSTFVTTPYLMLVDQAREAMGYYQSVFGGELDVQTYSDMGMSADPSNDDRVMHAQLEAPNGFMLMASDVPDGTPHQPGESVHIALSGDDEPELRRVFDALADGATIHEALTQAPWGDTFGALTDRYGISWMVNISPAAE